MHFKQDMAIAVLMSPLVQGSAYTVDCCGICFQRIEWFAKYLMWRGPCPEFLLGASRTQNSNIGQGGYLKQVTTIVVSRGSGASLLSGKEEQRLGALCQGPGAAFT